MFSGLSLMRVVLGVCATVLVEVVSIGGFTGIFKDL